MDNPLKGQRILFYVPEGNVETNGVYASQVLGLARYCVRLGASCLVFQWSPQDNCGGGIRERRLEDGIGMIEDTVPRSYRQFWFQTRDYKKLNTRFQSFFVKFAPTHIYCRQYQTCRAAEEMARSFNAQLIYSMRGPDAFERKQMGGLKNIIASWYVKWAVRKAMKACNRFTTMSESFAKWNKKKFGKDAVVFPCCVTDGFFERVGTSELTKIRETLGFAIKDKIVVWCGGIFIWQRMDDVVELLKGMSELDSTVKSLFIVKEADEMRKICERHKYNASFFRILSLSPKDVPKYLQACDIGIDCLLQNDFKCSICCPVKIGEYLASGLPVLATSNMGDVPNRLTSGGAGAILDEPLNARDALVKMERLLKLDDSVMVDCANRYYSWAGNQEAIKRLFS